MNPNCQLQNPYKNFSLLQGIQFIADLSPQHWKTFPIQQKSADENLSSVILIVPHPPFVLGRNGEPIRPNYPYVTGDGASFASNSDIYIKGYTTQVDYINKQILDVIDNILKNSDTPPVIVIQGDHGPGYLLLQQGDTINSCLWERASILNAYYFPKGKTNLLYKSVSPINTFRIIFNTYLNGKFELQDDKTYFSSFDVPYNFIDITSTFRNKCGINK